MKSISKLNTSLQVSKHGVSAGLQDIIRRIFQKLETKFLPEFRVKNIFKSVGYSIPSDTVPAFDNRIECVL